MNTICLTEKVVNYPVSFLNCINVPGNHSHKIDLKVGVSIILFRNLNPPKLSNSTRLRIVSLLNKNLIEAILITGCCKGESVFIPRIPITLSNYPLKFKRL